MEFENILYSQEDGIAEIRINRPEAFNALNTATNREIARVLDTVEGDSDIRVLIVRGSEKAFVAGADVKELMDADPQAAFENCCVAHGVFQRIENLGIPVIAAINGPALGGGLELALSCDFRIAGEKAFFGLPEITLGIIPGAGGTQRLAKLIGVSRAKEMIFLGGKVDSETALGYGLVNRRVGDAEVHEAAEAMARELKKMPAVALKLAKESVNFGFNKGLDEGREFEKRNFSLAFATEDQKEGMRAFVERRAPEFKNR